MIIKLKKNLDKLEDELQITVENLPLSVYDNIDTSKEFPLMANLSKEKYDMLSVRINTMRKEIIDFYTVEAPEERLTLSHLVKDYQYFQMFFVPNKDFLTYAENKEEFLLEILIAISIQNLSDDIRDLIIYVNELKKRAGVYAIDFNKLLSKVISISSDVPVLYSISMKDFFEKIKNVESIPVEVNPK